MMGRPAGHLALGIGGAAGATLTVVAEEFPEGHVRIQRLVDILEGAIVKRLVHGRDYGVALLAEGLLEKLDPQNSWGRWSMTPTGTCAWRSWSWRGSSKTRVRGEPGPRGVS